MPVNDWDAPVLIALFRFVGSILRRSIWGCWHADALLGILLFRQIGSLWKVHETSFGWG